MCTYVCMYACMYACMHACNACDASNVMYVCMYICTYVCMCTCKFDIVFVHVCMTVCTCEWVCGCVPARSITGTYICFYEDTHTIYIYIMMQGCHTPPPPPSPCYPPLPVKWVVVLFGLVAFPVWSCLASSPPPLWSGTWLAAPRLWGAVCSTEVWYGCCHLLVAMSSLRALSPPPPVGWGLWSFWLAPPSLWGSVFCRDMVWLLPLVSSNVIVTCSLPYKV